MGRGKFGWGLPPGVRPCDIPGSRPDDEEVEVDVALDFTVGEIKEVMSIQYPEDSTANRVMNTVQCRLAQLGYGERDPDEKSGIDWGVDSSYNDIRVKKADDPEDPAEDSALHGDDGSVTHDPEGG